MNTDCLDIGLIQAFLDGELDHHQTARVSGHIELCDACTLLLAEAEEEISLVFPVLEREFDALVPTQRLWNKINDSIKTERDNRPFWEKAWTFISVSLASPSLATAASMVLVIAVFAGLWLNKTTVDVDQSQPNVARQTTMPTTAAPIAQPVVASNDSIDGDDKPVVARTGDRERQQPRRETVIQSLYKAPVTESAYMPGEENYIKTISTLTKTVDDQKSNGIMRPAERIAYERDMALVNDAIAKMKNEVRRNPKNDSAKQVLYATYQNKIDLLNSVAQKEELLVSLR